MAVTTFVCSGWIAKYQRQGGSEKRPSFFSQFRRLENSLATFPLMRTSVLSVQGSPYASFNLNYLPGGLSQNAVLATYEFGRTQFSP
jgi:hypothetical protein